MSEDVIITYKKIGETPLESLEKARKERGIATDIPMTYAGRLDPMAEGLMIILAGDECKNKEKYLGLDKTYEFEILVGFTTDTYDLLGLITSEYTNSSHLNPLSGGSDADSEFAYSDVIKDTVPKFIGNITQKYPPFSSKTVNGKQLFQLSKEGGLPEILPTHEVTIYNLRCTSTMIQKKKDLYSEVQRRINLVQGDFRQKEILESWARAFKDSNQQEYTVLSCICECSSGTYIRQLVHDISEQIGMPLVTYSIKRIKLK